MRRVILIPVALALMAWFTGAGPSLVDGDELPKVPGAKTPPAPKEPPSVPKDRPVAKKKARPKAKEDDKITMTVITRTGSQNRRGRADPYRIYLLLNADNDHKVRLKNPNQDNFELGATDKFENLPVTVDLDKIESVRLLTEGKDMWKCEWMTVQFFQKGKGLESPVYRFSVDRYLSAEREKSAFRAIPSKDFRFAKPPKLEPPKEKEAKTEEKS